MNLEPICPNCGDTLEEDDCYDTSLCGDCYARYLVGTCPTCKKEYRWTEFYEITGVDSIEEC